jgi:hypothetical protein
VPSVITANEFSTGSASRATGVHRQKSSTATTAKKTTFAGLFEGTETVTLDACVEEAAHFLASAHGPWTSHGFHLVMHTLYRPLLPQDRPPNLERVKKKVWRTTLQRLFLMLHKGHLGTTEDLTAEARRRIPTLQKTIVTVPPVNEAQTTTLITMDHNNKERKKEEFSSSPRSAQNHRVVYSVPFQCAMPWLGGMKRLGIPARCNLSMHMGIATVPEWTRSSSKHGRCHATTLLLYQWFACAFGPGSAYHHTILENRLPSNLRGLYDQVWRSVQRLVPGANTSARYHVEDIENMPHTLKPPCIISLERILQQQRVHLKWEQRNIYVSYYANIHRDAETVLRLVWHRWEPAARHSYPPDEFVRQKRSIMHEAHSLVRRNIQSGCKHVMACQLCPFVNPTEARTANISAFYGLNVQQRFNLFTMAHQSRYPYKPGRLCASLKNMTQGTRIEWINFPSDFTGKQTEEVFNPDEWKLQ